MIEANPNIAAMDAYALPDISAAPGLDAIVLAQNEHACAPSRKVREAVAEAIASGHLYPDSECAALRAAIAARHDIDADRIVCGSGSMELMAALVLAYLSPSRRVLMTQYGYLYMRTLAKLVGAPLDSAAERDFRVDVDAVVDALRPDTRLVFLVNPGNPCGSVLHNDEIRRLREALPDDVLLLVDEAYAEFVDDDFHAPLFDLVDEGNTAITRTFSKIYGLAGMRVGWGYFPAELRDQLRKVLNPGGISQVSQAAALAAISDRAGERDAFRLIVEQREKLQRELGALGLDFVPSQTNFVLIDFGTPERAASAFEFLRENRLVLRPMGGYGLPACLRVTVGTPQQMHLTAQALGEWYARHG